jgi:hypothetical protein
VGQGEARGQVFGEVSDNFQELYKSSKKAKLSYKNNFSFHAPIAWVRFYPPTFCSFSENSL